MKRTLRVYKKTVSIVNETAIGMYQNLVGNKVGFLLESYDKNYDRYTFMGAEPEELISYEGQSLVITRADGSREVRKGNPLNQLKAYYSEFEIKNDHAELNFSGGLVGQLGYDFIRYTEVLPDDNPDEIGIETIQMMLMTKFLMIDHVFCLFQRLPFSIFIIGSQHHGCHSLCHMINHQELCLSVNCKTTAAAHTCAVNHNRVQEGG